MAYLLTAAFFLSAFLAVMAGYEIFLKDADHLQGRLLQLGQSQQEEELDEMKKPFAERVLTPGYERFIATITKATPKSIRMKYEKLIQQSGYLGKMTPSNIISMQVMMALIVVGVSVLLASGMGKPLSPMLYPLIILIAFMVPYSFFNTKAQKRRLVVQNQLPDMLDLLYISVEAGLGFDMALKKSTDKMKGPLSEEIKRGLSEISKGKGRQEAFRGIIQRTGVDDVNTFITAVIQSEMLGTNIANMLRVQSHEMRQRRRQRAEEKAQKIPIKMLFPLIFFMLPALFIVILGPAGINMIKTLTKM
ncbi:type II secretion system F family protein [Proteiniclasticum sp. BAD-10]|uniref:Type II secretion system F family protein n=1 Tax=Proteiniclasticum sediminis TaxID=2804028 RepID=A0A941HP95_9CLOT|nr:type II secretion system F family protein [Proteiniclasticum sediminis]MBR0575261.1 type II secretion system F family protein [Proteiniclasticum sediminis]